ncbi:hypothetical protein Tco_0775238, partial [Tanacetum coccineum]
MLEICRNIAGDGGRRGVKEKQQGSANDTTKVTIMVAYDEDGPVLSSLGGHTVKKVIEYGNNKDTRDGNVDSPSTAQVDGK